MIHLIANWKMSGAPAGWEAPDSPYRPRADVQVVVCPLALDVRTLVAAGLCVGGQAARSEAQGAFTGDVSLAQLQAAGCSYVLCGHSERRQYHGETDEQVAMQVTTALALGLKPVVCVGERDGEDRAAVLRQQLASLPTDGEFLLAYEPVWAIGTGKAAAPADAAAAIEIIHNLGFTQPVLYGGSVKAANVEGYLRTPGVAGCLVGGASLIVDEWRAMVAVASSLRS
jgi:triosephosphate isomerase (TIM)